MKSTEGDYVSFFEEGESYMMSQLQKVDLYFVSCKSYGGLGIHHHDSRKTMKP